MTNISLAVNDRKPLTMPNRASANIDAFLALLGSAGLPETGAMMLGDEDSGAEEGSDYVESGAPTIPAAGYGGNGRTQHAEHFEVDEDFGEALEDSVQNWAAGLEADYQIDPPGRSQVLNAFGSASRAITGTGGNGWGGGIPVGRAIGGALGVVVGGGIIAVAVIATSPDGDNNDTNNANKGGDPLVATDDLSANDSNDEHAAPNIAGGIIADPLPPGQIPDVDDAVPSGDESEEPGEEIDQPGAGPQPVAVQAPAPAAGHGGGHPLQIHDAAALQATVNPIVTAAVGIGVTAFAIGLGLAIWAVADRETFSATFKLGGSSPAPVDPPDTQSPLTVVPEGGADASISPAARLPMIMSLPLPLHGQAIRAVVDDWLIRMAPASGVTPEAGDAIDSGHAAAGWMHAEVPPLTLIGAPAAQLVY